MITPLVASIVIGLQTAQLPKLELSNPGVSFRNLVPAIEAQTGWKVSLSPEVANEVIVIRTNGRPAEETLTKIGEATSTIWKLDDGVLSITADTSKRDKAFKAVMDDYWKKMSAHRLEEIQLLKTKEYENSEGEIVIDEITASDQVLINIINEFTIARLRKMEFGDRVVYAMNPNTMQSQLNLLNEKIFQSLLPELRAANSFSEEDIADFSEDFQLKLYLENAGRTLESILSELQQVEPTKLLLSVAISEFGNYVEFRLFYVNRMGEILDLNSAGFSYENGELTDQDGYPNGLTIDFRKGDATPLTQSQESLDIIKLDNYSNRDRAHLKLQPNLAELLTQPDKYEPLRYTGGDLLYQAAIKLDRPLIASLGDSFDLPLERIKTIGDLRESLKAFGYLDSLEQNWWKVSSEDGVSNWLYRFDRRDLQNAISFEHNKMMMPIDNFAELVYKSPHSIYIPYVQSRLSLFSNATSFSGIGDLIGVFGGLSDTQRSVLRSGGAIPLSGVSDGVRSLVFHLTYGHEGGVKDNSRKNSIVVQEQFDLDEMYSGRDYSRTREVTEVLPNGISQGHLKMNVEPGKYLIARVDDPFLARSADSFTRSDLLMISLFVDPDRFYQQMLTRSPSLSQMRLGDYREMELKVELVPGLGHKSVFQEYSDPYSDGIYGVPNWPDEIKVRLQADYEEYASTGYGKLWISRLEEIAAKRKRNPPPPRASDLAANRG